MFRINCALKSAPKMSMIPSPIDMKKTATLGMLLALSLILSYVEILIPIPLGIPGIKLGLPNLLVILTLFFYGPKESGLLCVLRIALVAVLFGSMYSFLYSLVGGLLAFAAECLAKRSKFFSLWGVSMVGGIVHNIGQILVAYFVVNTRSVFFYLTILLPCGMITGVLIGFVCILLLPVGRKIMIQENLI